MRIDTLSGWVTYKAGSQIGLRTSTDVDVHMTCPGIGRIDLGDNIIVVVCMNRILAVENVSLGTAHRYRTTPPFRKETMGIIAWAAFIWSLIMLPVASYEAVQLPFSNAFSAYGTIWLELVIIVWFFSWWRMAKNFNYRLEHKISDAIVNALADPKRHDIEHV